MPLKDILYYYNLNMYSHNIFRNEPSYQKKGNQIDKYVFLI